MRPNNPLYIVKGQDVHQAASFLDALILKLGIAPVLNVFKNIYSLILESLKGKSLLDSLEMLVEQVLGALQSLAEGQRA